MPLFPRVSSFSGVSQTRICGGSRLDISQASADQVIFIDNTAMFVQIAEEMGIRSIHHVDYKSTCAKLASFGLKHGEGVRHETR